MAIVIFVSRDANAKTEEIEAAAKALEAQVVYVDGHPINAVHVIQN